MASNSSDVRAADDVRIDADGRSDADVRSTAGDGVRPAGSRTPLRATADNALKIVVVGGFGVGKTTLVGSVSEIRPLNTEEVMTRAGEGIDPAGTWGKRSTTVAFDFGRITLSERQVLYLFGAPGQERFWFLWDRLFSGALGAVVLVDTRRLEESWYAIDRLEHHGTPFIVARNNFGEPSHTLEQVREALDLPAEVPLVDCDARDRESGKRVLIALVHHLAALAGADAASLADGAAPVTADGPAPVAAGGEEPAPAGSRTAIYEESTP
ncbi:GTP-binding protein [Kitasatospora sp. NPDC001132]